MKRVSEQTRLERAGHLKNIRKAKVCTAELISDMLKITKKEYQKIKLKIMLRLFHYFTKQKPPVYMTGNISLESQIKAWLNNDGGWQGDI